MGYGYFGNLKINNGCLGAGAGTGATFYNGAWSIDGALTSCGSPVFRIASATAETCPTFHGIS